MRTALRIAIALVTCLSPVPPALAQEKEPPRIKTGSGFPSGKRAPRSDVSVSVRLEGLPKDQSAGLLDALLTWKREVFVCATCPASSHGPADCTACRAPMAKKEDATVVARARLEREYLSVHVRPHHWIALSELDALVTARGGKVQRAGFRIPPHAQLVVRGGTEKDAGRLRGALVDRDLVAAATTRFEPDGNLLVVRTKLIDGESLQVAAIEELLGLMRGELRLEDVRWATYCPECGKEPSGSTTFAVCSKRP